jgi:hypothetical protein
MVSLWITTCEAKFENKQTKYLIKAYIWNNVFEPGIKLHELVEPGARCGAGVFPAIVEHCFLEVNTCFEDIGR